MKSLVILVLILTSVLVKAEDKPTALEAWKIAALGQITRFVELPPNTPSEAKVGFSIRQNRLGEVISIRLTSSSGNRTVDQAVIKAVQHSSPLPPHDQQTNATQEIDLTWKKQ